MKCKYLLFGGGSDMAVSFAKSHSFETILLDEHECDVRYYKEVEFMMKKYQAETVINFAGYSHVSALKNGFPRYAKEITTNLIGSFNIAKAAVDNKINMLIFIASVAGLYGKAEHAGYSASKAGVISLVRSLGMEKYNAFAISPGRVNTKMREHDYPGEDKRTRLTCDQITEVIDDCLKGKYQPGDNIIIRKIGYDTFLRIDRGEPWKEYLNIQPIGTPKTI
jgi:NAD(P)-dependent dehydrogenase (short-subunit alcohol dehydrogenase family)